MAAPELQAIAILTVAVGADYCKAMAPGLESKRNYARKHNYTYVEYNDAIYEKARPVAWYKLMALKKYLTTTPNPAQWVFFSDADVLITNPDIKLETFIAQFPQQANFVWTLDACGHLNSGNVFYRTEKPTWCLNFIEKIWAKTEYIYHPWWENAAMISLYYQDPEIKAQIHTILNAAATFNAYVFAVPTPNAIQNIIDLVRSDADPWLTAVELRLYKPGDFLVHFAGVYDTNAINTMMTYFQSMAKDQSPDFAYLQNLRQTST